MNQIKSPFTQATSVLSTLMIGILAFFQEYTAKILLIILLAGTVFLLCRYAPKHGYLSNKSRKSKHQPFQKHSAPQLETQPSPPVIYQGGPLLEDAPKSALDEKIMMRHISNRISEKLKSAYPEATWQYDPEPALGYILNGGTVRIETENTDRYTHADVRFDKFAKIQIDMLIKGDFQAVDTPKPADAEAPVPKVVDVDTWYHLIGQSILENVITDLNAKGHKKLFVQCNGDILAGAGNKRRLVNTLDHFPGKNYWKELQDILTADDLRGSIDKDQFIISWQ